MRRALLALSVLLITALVPASAQAYANAFFPTQSSGNRGADVQAIQFLLQYAGQTVDADGVFGASTVTAAKAFQTAKGLGVDGIVGPQTWTALTPTIRSGDNNAAVKALQVELNAKRRLSLPVDGVFSTAVHDALVSFQSHAGIGADGIVGPITWRNLAWHYDYPDFASNLCDQDPDGNDTAANWAAAAPIAQLEAAAKSFTSHGKIPYGDAGFEHGGDIPGHASHDNGMDIDIWPIRTDNAQCTAGRITWESPTYDRAATRQLIQAVRAAAPGHVKYIWFNDPTLINEGLTMNWPAHDNHLHVRYCEKVHPNSTYVC
ncbi:penicillin-insensitive murein endopeptidase [Kribbella sp. NPDC000426]|uniref:penicillin-insensitive murein endopeptidase n=1 Tax=Kribbella sp. NPDC000426 TaxID=3154255 RepID=UPI00332FAA6B